MSGGKRKKLFRTNMNVYLSTVDCNVNFHFPYIKKKKTGIDMRKAVPNFSMLQAEMWMVCYIGEVISPFSNS